jgi:hypothetical protein
MMRRMLGLGFVLAVSACGSDGGGSKGSSDADVDGTNLADAALFGSACFGTVNADFSTDPSQPFSFAASFTAGEKLLLNMLSATFGDNPERIVYRADPKLQGARTYHVPADKLTVDCAGYAAAVAVMSQVELFSDEALTSPACTLEAGKVYAGGQLGGHGTSAVNDDASGFVTFSALPGSPCPTGSNLYYVPPTAEIKSGGVSSTEVFEPMLTIYVK